MKGQAMVIDGLFFLIICSAAAVMLLWSVSNYGDSSFEAYRFLYLNDYETSTLALLSGLEYDIGAGAPVPWLDQLGRYMITGDENIRGELDSQWLEICKEAPAPLFLTVFHEDSAYQNNEGYISQPLYFACGRLLDPSSNFSLFEHERHPDTKKLLYNADGTPQLVPKVDPDSGLELVNVDGDPIYVINEYKKGFSYYSSPLESKPCNVLRCELEIKIYY